MHLLIFWPLLQYCVPQFKHLLLVSFGIRSLTHCQFEQLIGEPVWETSLGIVFGERIQGIGLGIRFIPFDKSFVLTQSCKHFRFYSAYIDACLNGMTVKKCIQKRIALSLAVLFVSIVSVVRVLPASFPVFYYIA